MSSSGRWSVATALAVALCWCAPGCAADAPESVSVPLHVLQVEGEERKIGIEVSLGGGPPRLYELDTGGSGFYAAYDAASWPTYEPLPGGEIVEQYGSGVEFHAQRVATTVAIPSDHGDVTADVHVARITEAFGGPLGPRDASTWQRDVDAGIGPLYGHFFGNFGGDLRSRNGLASVLPQLPGNLSSGFVVELGCERPSGPRLVIGLTDAIRARFTSRVAMQPGDGTTFPHSGLPTYAQHLLHVDFRLARGDAVQTFRAGALLDTGGPTTHIYQGDRLRLDGALLDEDGHLVRPGIEVEIRAAGVDGGAGLDLDFRAGEVPGRDRVEVADDGGDDVNLGLIPFFRSDVMFDVQNGVVGFAPCE